MSGSRQGGQGGHTGRGLGQPQGDGLWQRLHSATSSDVALNPSRVLVNALLKTIPRTMPISRASPGITILTDLVIGYLYPVQINNVN